MPLELSYRHLSPCVWSSHTYFLRTHRGKVAKYPIIPLRLFRSTFNVAEFGIAYIHGAVFIVDTYDLPLYFQSVIGATSLLSGVYLPPVAITLCVVFIPHRNIPWLSLAMASHRSPSIPVMATHRHLQVISGIGLGPILQAPIIALFSLTKSEDIASAAATITFARDIGIISIAFDVVIFQNRIAAHSAEHCSAA